MATTAPTAEMPFLDHLEELRWRLIWSLLGFAIGVTVAFVLLTQFNALGILQEPIAPYLKGRKLVVTRPGESLGIVLNAAVMLGAVLASPVIGYQIWAFLAPALYQHEKRVVIPVLISGVALFLLGVWLAVGVVLPFTLEFLLTFQMEALEPMITASGYFGFVLGMSLAFGAVFELPLVIVGLTAVGIVTPKFLNTYRRHAIVLCVVGAAFITPGADPTSLFALSVPLYLLFEVSVLCSTLVYRRRLKKERDALLREEAEAARIAPPAPTAPLDRAPRRLDQGDLA